MGFPQRCRWVEGRLLAGSFGEILGRVFQYWRDRQKVAGPFLRWLWAELEICHVSLVLDSAREHLLLLCVLALALANVLSHEVLAGYLPVTLRCHQRVKGVLADRRLEVLILHWGER